MSLAAIIRAFLLTATEEEMRSEYRISLELKDRDRAEVIKNYMIEEGYSDPSK